MSADLRSIYIYRCNIMGEIHLKVSLSQGIVNQIVQSSVEKCQDTKTIRRRHHEDCVDANVELSLGWTFDFVHCPIMTLMIYTQYIAANRTDKVHISHSKKLGV